MLTAKVPAIEAAMTSILDAGAAPLAIGGDHFTTYPSIKAHAKRLGRPVALVHFDAHSDLWDGGGPDWIDHGTMFRDGIAGGEIDAARSIQVGIRTTNDDTMGVETYDAIKVHETGIAATIAAIRARVGDAPVYLTFDIDCLDPAFAPGTGTPVCGGLASCSESVVCGASACGGHSSALSLSTCRAAPSIPRSARTAPGFSSLALVRSTQGRVGRAQRMPGRARAG